MCLRRGVSGVGNATADIRQNAKLSSCLSATGRRGSWPTPPNPHLAKKGVRLTPYEVGYYKRWRKEGFKDGEQGLFRSSKFENKDYDWGWIEAMEKSISRASNMSGMKRIFLVWSAAMSAKTIGGGTASVKLNGR